MTAAAVISIVRRRLPWCTAAQALEDTWTALLQTLARIARWARKAMQESPHAHRAAEFPRCLPGHNQLLVQRSWAEQRRGVISEDGRLRLRGRDTLDVCATPGETERALRQFACWLDYLAGDGIGVEIRQLDGWRTCAVVDGEAVPIRIRERMRRVWAVERSDGVMLRWLRPIARREFVPSRCLELQILRMGVAVARFPLEGGMGPSTLESASQAIRSTAKRNVDFERRMTAAAIGGKYPVAHTSPVSLRHSGERGLPPEVLSALSVLSAFENAQSARPWAAEEWNLEGEKSALEHSLVCLAHSIAREPKARLGSNAVPAPRASSLPIGVLRAFDRRRRVHQAA